MMPSGWELREDALSSCLAKDEHQNWRRSYCWVCDGWVMEGQVICPWMDGLVGGCVHARGICTDLKFIGRVLSPDPPEASSN